MDIPVPVWFWLIAVILIWLSTLSNEIFGALFWIGVFSGLIGLVLAWKGAD